MKRSQYSENDNKTIEMCIYICIFLIFFWLTYFCVSIIVELFCYLDYPDEDIKKVNNQKID